VKEKFRNNLLLFGKVISRHSFYKPFAKVHFEIEEILLNKSIKKANMIVPRGIAKTTIAAMIYPLYHIFVEERVNPDRPKVIVIISKTQGHSVNVLTSIKNALEYNVNFKDIFGYHGKQVAETWREDQITLDTGDVIIAKGMGQPIRGMNFNSVRPSVIILDDPEDENNTKTAEAMDANLDWVIGGALPALDEDIGRFILIGTPLHQLCLVERFAKAPDWHTIRKKCLIENEGVYSSIWEEHIPVQKLLAEKRDLEAIGKISKFYSERQCEIVGDSEQLFKPAYIQHWRGEYFRKGDDSFIKIDDRTIPINVFMGVDPASSVTNTADYTVIFAVGIDAEFNRYCLAYVRKRMEPMAVADSIESMYQFYKPQRVRIESVGYQEMLRSYLRTKTYIPGLEIKEMPRNSKSSRLASLQPEFAQMKVYLKEDMTEFEDELLMFPRGAHDDILDAYFYAVKNVYTPYHGLETKMDDEEEFFSSNDWLLS